jgi:membrane protein implicated in regulation of membrane protease activity
MPPEVILWIALLVLFIVIEATTVSLYCLWFALGSLAAIIPALLEGPLWLQLLIFTVISAAGLALLRPIAKQYLKRPAARTNSDRNIGEIGVCTERIDNQTCQGAVRLMGKEWTARSSDDAVIETGTSVRVDAINGVKLIVSPVSTPVREEVTV